MENSMNSKENTRQLFRNFAKTAGMIEEALNQFYKNYKITKAQFNALYSIYLKGDAGIKLSDLGVRMFVAKANITSLVDRMESRCLIKRVSNPDDRRSIKVVITDMGKEIIEDILPNSAIFSKNVLGFLTEDEKKRCNELLLKIQEELRENYLND